MYTFKQAENIFTEQIALEKADGQKEIIDVSTPLTQELVKKYRQNQSKLAEAEKITDGLNKAEIVGELVWELLILLFGEENAKKILVFFGSDISSALMQIFPYIQQELAPKLAAVVKERKQVLGKWMR